MDQQGAGRSRRAAGAGRQPPWPPEGAPGDSAFPGDSPFPGDPAFPGDTPFSGDSPFPGDPAFPGTAPFPQDPVFPGGGGPTGPLPGRVRKPGAGSSRVPGPGTGPSRVPGPGTGPQRLTGSGTGSRPAFSSGTAARPAFPPGTGARPAFPPDPGAPPGPGVFPGGGHPASAPTPPAGFPAAGLSPGGSFSDWHAPGEPLDGQAAADTADVYRPDDTFIFDPKAADRAPQAAAPPADRRGGDRNRRRLAPRVAWIAAAAVVAAAAGFAGWKYLYEARVNAPVPSTLRLPTTAPSDNGLDQTLGRWQHIGSRSQDPQPLTIAALFPPQFELHGTSYARTAASITKTCSLAVYGADLQAALQTGHCSQVARASYLSGDGTMMGTVGVVNLISANAAQKAGKATSTQEILAPLTSKKGPTSKLGNGTGVVQAEIKGHYLILVYAEYASLKSPSGTAQRQALEQFAMNIITGSANINLSTRMLTGKQ